MTTLTPVPQNRLLLNYHDAVLYGSDLALLDSPTAWLNDACIHFYQTVLQQQHPNIKFMDPSVITFLMHQCDEDDLKDFSTSLDKECESYVIPINDGHASSNKAWQERPGGGSHWSLLVILQGPLYLHFDSVTGSNASAARAVAQCFSKVLRHEKALAKEVNTPQQQNGYDCGLHALATAEVLIGAGVASVEDSEQALINSKLGQPAFGLDTRRKIRNKAVEFAKEYRTVKGGDVADGTASYLPEH